MFNCIVHRILRGPRNSCSLFAPSALAVKLNGSTPAGRRSTCSSAKHIDSPHLDRQNVHAFTMWQASCCR